MSNFDQNPNNQNIAPTYTHLEKNRPPSSIEVGEQPSTIRLMFRELVETVVLSLIIFLLLSQVVQNYRIEKQSMVPNFCPGQFILANKLAYVLGEPKRGDVVIFHNPHNAEEDYIKRIVGLPGDSVAIHNQQVWINGQVLDEPLIQNQIPPNEAYAPVVVEVDRLFVLGDNRPNSSDSRNGVGQLPQNLLVGKAWARIWPFDRIGLVQHGELESTSTSDAITNAPAAECAYNPTLAHNGVNTTTVNSLILPAK